jgi:hypothetical protein
MVYYLPWTVSLEVLAWVTVVLFVVKMLFLFIKPSGWFSLTKKVYSKSIFTTIISLVLAYVVLGSLIAAGISYVEIFAVILLFVFLAGISVAAYSDEFFKLSAKLLKDRSLLKKSWLAILIWVALTVLVVIELLA